MEVGGALGGCSNCSLALEGTGFPNADEWSLQRRGKEQPLVTAGKNERL